MYRCASKAAEGVICRVERGVAEKDGGRGVG